MSLKMKILKTKLCRKKTGNSKKELLSQNLKSINKKFKAIIVKKTNQQTNSVIKFLIKLVRNYCIWNAKSGSFQFNAFQFIFF